MAWPRSRSNSAVARSVWPARARLSTSQKLQHAARPTVSDRAAEDAALSLASRPPVVAHLFVPAEGDEPAAER